MYTLDELAEELNRKEWAVERMLINRGYLKQNGDPRKWTIDDGLMNKSGLIKEAGWSTFISELGYKDSDDDEDEDDELDEESSDDDDEESEDEDGDDDDFDAYSKIRSRLSGTELDGEVDSFYSLWEAWWEKDSNSNDVDEQESFDTFASSVIDSCIGYIAEGHTSAFAMKFAENYGEYDYGDDNDIFNALSDSERQEDAESWASQNLDELNQASIDYFLEIIVDSDDFSGSVDTAREFDEKFQEAIDAGKDEDTAEKYARWCLDRDAGFAPPTGDNPTSKSLSDLSDENFDEEFEEWLEEKYGITVLNISGSTVRYEYEDLVFEREFDFNSEDWCDDGLIDILLN